MRVKVAAIDEADRLRRYQMASTGSQVSQLGWSVCGVCVYASIAAQSAAVETSFKLLSTHQTIGRSGGLSCKKCPHISASLPWTCLKDPNIWGDLPGHVVFRH